MTRYSCPTASDAATMQLQLRCMLMWQPTLCMTCLTYSYSRRQNPLYECVCQHAQHLTCYQLPEEAVLALELPRCCSGCGCNSQATATAAATVQARPALCLCSNMHSASPAHMCSSSMYNGQPACTYTVPANMHNRQRTRHAAC